MTTNEPDGIEILDIDDPEAGLLAYAIGRRLTIADRPHVDRILTDAAKDGARAVSHAGHGGGCRA